MKIEQSLVLIKPDALEQKKVGQIITRLEEKGLKLQAMKMIWLDEELVAKHYAEHKEKEFYSRLVDYITERPVIAMVVAGKNALQVVRNLSGETDPLAAAPGTIRGDFGLDLETGNLVHASDSAASAEREIDLFFTPDEIYTY